MCISGQGLDWNAMRWSWKRSLGLFPCIDDHYMFTLSFVQARPWIIWLVKKSRSPAWACSWSLEWNHGADMVEAADIQAWFHLWVSLIPRSRLESEQNVSGLCSALRDSQWCSTGWDQLGFHSRGFLFSLWHMQALCVNWSNLKLPWVDLDWLIDISCQITELDLSANCLVSLPSVIPWGLINLRKLSLADNQLTELPTVQSSDEIICTRWVLHTKLSLQVEQLKLGLREAV